MPLLTFRWRAIAALVVISYGVGYSHINPLPALAYTLRAAAATIEQTSQQPIGTPSEAHPE